MPDVITGFTRKFINGEVINTLIENTHNLTPKSLNVYQVCGRKTILLLLRRMQEQTLSDATPLIGQI